MSPSYAVCIISFTMVTRIGAIILDGRCWIREKESISFERRVSSLDIFPGSTSTYLCKDVGISEIHVEVHTYFASKIHWVLVHMIISDPYNVSTFCIVG